MAYNVDSNQKEIVKCFREAGATVDHLHFVGHGFPDLSVMYRGFVILVEIKSGHHQLNELQRSWHDEHPGLVFVVRKCEEVTKIIEQIDMLRDIIEPYDIPIIKKIKEAK